MSETQDERTVRQERVARMVMPQLGAIADELGALMFALFERRIPYRPDDGADVMALSFVTKQREHLHSVRVLIEDGAHRDALLIARTMLEGLGRLLWAFNKKPERTELWFWFGAIVDWRQTKQNEAREIFIDPQEKAELKAYVDKHGASYYRANILKGIEAAQLEGAVYDIPDDPWRTDWTKTTVEAMFTEVAGSLWYDEVYRTTSEWVHWGPRAIQRARQAAEWGTSGFTEEDWRAAAAAMTVGCLSVIQSLEILDAQFALGIDEHLAELDKALSS